MPLRGRKVSHQSNATSHGKRVNDIVMRVASHDQRVYDIAMRVASHDERVYDIAMRVASHDESVYDIVMRVASHDKRAYDIAMRVASHGERGDDIVMRVASHDKRAYDKAKIVKSLLFGTAEIEQIFITPSATWYYPIKKSKTIRVGSLYGPVSVGIAHGYFIYPLREFFSIALVNELFADYLDNCV